MKFFKRGKLLITVGVGSITIVAALAFLGYPFKGDLAVSFLGYGATQDCVTLRLTDNGKRDLECFFNQKTWDLEFCYPHHVIQYSQSDSRVVVANGKSSEVKLRYLGNTNAVCQNLQVFYFAHASDVRLIIENLMLGLLGYDIRQTRRRSVIVELPPFSEATNVRIYRVKLPR